ncbi:hypothetical protein [Pseudoalteromonas phenolica]|nr:hypothetical protein [Pseudoalteromonas phenolica]
MHPFSLKKQDLAQVSGGVFPGGCILTPVKGEDGDELVIIKL